MKATLKYKLPEEQPELDYALAGIDSLLVIEDILNEIRSALKHGGGEFQNCDTQDLETIRGFILTKKQERNLPELV